MQSKKQKRGFTLVELAIVLAVASLLFGGLWRLMASGSTQLRDQAVADQQKKVINAVRAFLESSDGQSFLGTIAVGGSQTMGIGSACSPASFCNYLPSELGSTAGTILNAYSQQYKIGVRNESAAGGGNFAYSFMVMTTVGETIADTSGGRIASMIGGDGGFIYSGATSATGAYGAWTTPPSNYGLNAFATAGHVASRSYYGYGADQFAPWLARTHYSTLTVTNGNGTATPDYNTLRAPTYFFQKDSSTSPVTGENDLYLGNNTIYGGLNSTAFGGAITNIQSISLQMVPAAGLPGMTINMNGSNTIGLAISNPSCSGGGACPSALQVGGDGYVTGQFSAASFIYTSDVRLKHDILVLDQAVEKLSKIKGVSFTLNSTNQKKIGVLAQDVEKVYPEAVSEIKDGYKGVDYMQLIGPLVAAVNELHAQDKVLAKQVQEQAQKIEALQKELAARSTPKAPASGTRP